MLQVHETPNSISYTNKQEAPTITGPKPLDMAYEYTNQIYHNQAIHSQPYPNPQPYNPELSQSHLLVNNIPSNQTKIAQGGQHTFSNANISTIRQASTEHSGDCNPIARYNFVLDQYENECNKIQGIQLIKIPQCSFISWLYDLILFFYYRAQFCSCCQPQVQLKNSAICSCFQHCSSLGTILIWILCIVILITPILSIIQLVVGSFYFLYYLLAVILAMVNNCRLRGHQFTENMVSNSVFPYLAKSKMNGYYQFQSAQISVIFSKYQNLSIFQKLIKLGHKKFMVYAPEFVEEFRVILSCKTFFFHILMIAFSCIGFVISVRISPSTYGQK